MKKIISLITILALVFSLIPQVMHAADTSTNVVGSGLVGDLSGEGSINSKDYALMKRYLLNYINSFPASDTFWAADLNGDGAINSKDLSLMKRYLLGIINIFPKVETTPTPTGTPVPTATPVPTDGVRIDFATAGDSTNMRCDFDVAAAVVWHWADGTTAAAISGAPITKDGLGAGTHQNYLTVSNSSLLTRFGAGNAGEGHLVSISGLQNCSNMAILYAYQENSLISIGDTDTTKVREYHLMGTRLSVAQLDGVFTNAAASGVQGGTLWADNSGTSASNRDKETLKTRGWTLNIPAWTPQTPLPSTG
ncbi:MAG TPA: dockerin type I repeat-containing protein, partial [Clostridia bacterium]